MLHEKPNPTHFHPDIIDSVAQLVNNRQCSTASEQ